MKSNKPNKRNQSQKTRNSALRFSIRISGTVTSLSLRRNIVSLWLVLNLEDIEGIDLQGKVSNFIYSCLSKWEKDTGKGFSDFVSDLMIEDILDSEDFDKYKQIATDI